MNTRLVEVAPINYKIKHASAKCFLCHMDRDVAFVRIGFYKIDLIPLAGFTVMTS